MKRSWDSPTGESFDFPSGSSPPAARVGVCLSQTGDFVVSVESHFQAFLFRTKDETSRAPPGSVLVAFRVFSWATPQGIGTQTPSP